MKALLSNLRRFFFGVRLFLPLVPKFLWLAFQKVSKSTIEYWKNSQSVVNELADSYLDQAMQKMTTEYSVGVFWTCYGIASLLYLLGWLAMAWLTVQAFQLVVSVIF